MDLDWTEEPEVSHLMSREGAEDNSVRLALEPLPRPFASPSVMDCLVDDHCRTDRPPREFQAWQLPDGSWDGPYVFNGQEDFSDSMPEDWVDKGLGPPTKLFRGPL